jgi:hypothetical protein
MAYAASIHNNLDSNKNIMFLDIIHPVFYLKHNISETGFGLRLQVLNKNWTMHNVQKKYLY